MFEAHLRRTAVPSAEYLRQRNEADAAHRVFGQLQLAMLDAARAAAENRLPWPWLRKLIIDHIDPLIRLDDFHLVIPGCDPLERHRSIWFTFGWYRSGGSIWAARYGCSP